MTQPTQCRLQARRRFLPCAGAVALALAILSTPGLATANPPHDASKHFQRGVALFNEADYRGALVEFKRAYAIAPNALALYNVGQTQFQLQDYAAALTTFRAYIAEASPSNPQHAEALRNVEVLKARVGTIAITTVPPGADIVVDNRPVGKTPIEQPVLVSIGHRKVTATMAGRPSVSRDVDVAADDSVSVTLELPASSEPPAAMTVRVPQDVSPSASNGSTLRVVGWVSTGVLAAGAITFGVLANQESSALSKEKGAFPASSTTLNHDANLTTAYSIVADSLTAAALVIGGITLFSTLTSGPSTPSRGSAGSLRVGIGPASLRVDGTF